MSKTNLGLCDYARAQVAENRPYWYGTYGCYSTPELLAEKRRAYPKYYTATDFKDQMGKKVHDCIGLAYKGYLWSESNDAPAKYDPKTDYSANDTIKLCKTQGDISTLPEIGGVMLWKEGHAGLYMTNGLVYEAKGHKWGCIASKLKDTKWKKWGLLPWIEYIGYTEFVERLYKNVLARDSEVLGKAYWVDALRKKTFTVTEVATLFLTSQEFINRNVSEKEFITILYRVFLDRLPDALDWWVKYSVENGRTATIYAFESTAEWQYTSQFITDITIPH